MARRSKQEIITFKVDEELARAMEGVPNRSEFIRRAILAALDNVCPLCKGTGSLTVEQQRHWEDFAKTHQIKRCADCSALYLVCAAAENDAHHSAGDANGHISATHCSLGGE